MSADNARVFAANHAAAEFVVFLDRQRAEFRRGLPHRLEAMEAVWNSHTAGDLEADWLPELERYAHNLAGTASTFGLLDVGEAARTLELRLRRLIDAEPLCSFAEVGAGLAQLRRTIGTCH